MKKSRRQEEAEMREEMEFHRQARVDDLMARGMSRDEAVRMARLEFGNAAVHREAARVARGYQPLDELRADLRYAARTLRNSPGFALAAVAILALAIGANAAFFTFYANYVLRPLPIRGAERNFDITGRNAQGMRTGGWVQAEREAFAAVSEVEGLYVAETLQVLLLAPVQRHALTTSVSPNYFTLLGGAAAMGRVLTEADGAQPVAVLSDSGWRRLLPGETNPLGKALRVNDTLYTVIGVMPPAFTGTELVVPDFWVRSAGIRPNLSGLLRPGASAAQAQVALAMLATRFARPEEERVARVQVEMRAGFLPSDEKTNVAAGMVFAVFLIVLLIACANLANLYLSRAAARTHEIAMRLSLGASRARVVRQLLTESTSVALLGAAGGLAVTVLALHFLNGYGASYAARFGMLMLPVSLDWRVFLYSAVLALAAGTAFGLLPALEVTSPSLTVSAKRENSSFAGRIRPRRMRDFLIGSQVAASLVLLILAAVLVRNMQRLEGAGTGYNLDQIFDLRVEKPSPELVARIGQLPGVVSVSGVARPPLYGRLDGSPARNYVDHRYFETMGLQVEAGRNFTSQEALRGAQVAVVSQATARKFWPEGAALGQTITLDEKERYLVIGVAPDVVSGFLFDGKDATLVYLPAAVGQERITSILARLQTNPAAIRELCAANGTGCEPAALRELAGMQQMPFQAAAGVAAVLGGLALLLTGIGLYSVASYAVLQRRREIGVHLALGATPARILRRIVGEAGRCVAWGVVVGMPVCLWVSKIAGSSRLRIETYDPAAYLGVPLLLAVITLAATAAPARRAAQIDPMQALRDE